MSESVSESIVSPYVEVALPVPLRKVFTYKVPNGLTGALQPGSRVAVSFSRRKLAGFVVGGRDDLPESWEVEMTFRTVCRARFPSRGSSNPSPCSRRSSYGSSSKRPSTTCTRSEKSCAPRLRRYRRVRCAGCATMAFSKPPKTSPVSAWRTTRPGR